MGQSRVNCHLKVTFTLEVSLFCSLGVTVDYKELWSLWEGQIPTCSSEPSVCVPRGNRYPSLWVSPEHVREWESKVLTSTLAGKNKGTQALSLLLSAVSDTVQQLTSLWERGG